MVLTMHTSSPSPIRLAAIGCGGRSRTYLGLAARYPDQFEVVAAADPNAHRVEQIRELSGNPSFRSFPDDRALLAEPRLADVMVIGTQDAYHVTPCLEALKKGYDVLLEKPISPHPEEVRFLELEAARLGGRVMVCHVLRYTPFYERVKELVTSGRIGELVSVHMTEGVETWHYTHSYVRGHWSVRETSSPMILAKSCHDLDILSWFVDRPCLRVSSFGDRRFFVSGRKPHRAPDRCTQGCPVGDQCPYNALHYLDRHRKWLVTVMDGAREAGDGEIRNWLEKSPWGRCVYTSDNNVVDRQVLSLEFDGGINATFTMTAFDKGRNLELFGTEGVIRGGDFFRSHMGCDLIVAPHHGGPSEQIVVEEPGGGADGHMGGDSGMVRQLYHEMRKVPAEEMKSSLARSVESHTMAFAADRARLEGRVVDLREFQP